MRRRSFIGSMMALAAAPFRALARPAKEERVSSGGAGPHVAVVGAGVFGGWTALQLLRAGARVTLIEAIDAGNYLSSSGGESRVIRHAYGDRIYVDMVIRALELWDAFGAEIGQRLLYRSGVLFMARQSGALADARRHMDEAGVVYEPLDREALTRRFPLVNPEGLDSGFLEPAAGYLEARLACLAVRDAVRAAGGEYRVARVTPGRVSGGEMAPLQVERGGELAADRYVFACGPWLGSMFPELIAPWLTITRQEIYFFRSPDPQRASAHAALPVWADFGERIWYGIPTGDGLFKVADDTRGAEVDPTTHSRAPTPAGIEAAAEFLAHRFPGLSDAALAGSRVCQYSQTPDGHFIADRHPAAENAWLLGGGSGHGFKHGPALGEIMADTVLERRPPEPAFALSRFRRASTG